MARCFLSEPALPVAVGDPHPFGVPALEIARDHPRSRLHHFADTATALLGLTQTATKLIGKPGMLGPMVPAEWLIMRTTIRGDQFNGIFADVWIRFRHERTPPSPLTGRPMVR